MQNATSPALSPRLNRDSGFLRAAAMLTMLVDHVGVIFFPGVTELRIIGRIAFPLFCWGVVTGFEHTGDWRKYARRLLLLGVVAQPFYMLALGHTWTQWNVLATLLLGLLSLAGMRERKWGSHIWVPLACLALAAIQPMDYGWRGVLLIQLMYLSRKSRGGLAAMFTAFCLYWGAQSSEVSVLLGYRIRPSNAGAWSGAVAMVFSFIRVQALALLALPLMVFPTSTGIKVPRWLNYAMYPGHLALLWALKQWL